MARIHGSSDYFLELYRHQGVLYKEPVAIQIGNVPSPVVSDIRGQLPNFMTLYLIDGTEEDRYWVIAIDSTEGKPQYIFSIFDPKDHLLSPGTSIDQLWQAVQTAEAMPQSSFYSQFDGIPTRENGDSSSELRAFIRDRTIYFRTKDGTVYAVKLLPVKDDLNWRISKR